MDRSDIFKAIQDLMREVPLFLIGTGGSMPYGLPGMPQLTKRIQDRLTPKYTGIAAWEAFLDRLNKGQNLESALTDLTLPTVIREDIVLETWQLVTEADLTLLENLVLKKTSLSALSGLLRYFYRPAPQRINIPPLYWYLCAE